MSGHPVIDVNKELDWLEKQTELHENNPALKDAYEQIQVIRTLAGYKPIRKGFEKLPTWEQKYRVIEEEVNFDLNSPAVKEAWEKYFMLKGLLTGEQ